MSMLSAYDESELKTVTKNGQEVQYPKRYGSCQKYFDYLYDCCSKGLEGGLDEVVSAYGTQLIPLIKAKMKPSIKRNPKLDDLLESIAC